MKAIGNDSTKPILHTFLKVGVSRTNESEPQLKIFSKNLKKRRPQLIISCRSI